MQITLLDGLLAHLEYIETSITELSAKWSHDIERLSTIPGIGTTSATAIIGEIGSGVSKFPTAEHFVLGLGLRPEIT